MESSGNVLVSMKSAVSFKENCENLHIQVIGRLPDTVARFNQERNFGSFWPHLQVITLQSEQINISEVSVGDFSMFSSIQDALDASPASSTISIPEGTYFETLMITKPVKLIGIGRTILFGSIQILSHDVTLSGVTIYSLEALNPVVEVISSFNVLIHDCMIEQGEYSSSDVLMRKTCAVYVDNSSDVSFVNSRVVNFGTGFHIWSSSRCVIQSNWIQSCWIALRISGSEDLRIMGNYMRENMILASLTNQHEKQRHLLSIVDENILEDNIRLTDNHEMVTRKISPIAVSNKTLKGLKMDSTVIVTGSCYDDVEELEPCAHYSTGRSDNSI